MIYLAQPTNGGPIRIGASDDVNARKRTMGTWIPGGVEVVLEIDGSFLGEAIIHHCFNPIRIERDWFKSCDAIWKFIIDTKSERPKWVPRDKGYARKFDPAAVIDEFGGAETAAKVLGYLNTVVFEQSLRNQTLNGFGLSSRILFARIVRDGRLPSYIMDLHRPEATTTPHTTEGGRAAA